MSKAPWGQDNKPKPYKTQKERDDIPQLSYYLNPNCTGGPAKGYVEDTGAVDFVNNERKKEENRRLMNGRNQNQIQSRSTEITNQEISVSK